MARKTNKKVIAEKVDGDVVSGVVTHEGLIPTNVDFGSYDASKDGALGRDGQLTDQKPDLSVLDRISCLKKHSDAILSCVSEVADSFVSIGDELIQIRDDKGLLEACGYKDVYDYSEKVFGFKRTSTKNFIAVASKFAVHGVLLDRYESYNFSQLVELLPVSEDISSFKPEMTVSQIRDKKVLEKARRTEDALRSWILSNVRAALGFLTGLSVSPRKIEEGHWSPSPYVYDFSGLYEGVGASGAVYWNEADSSFCILEGKLGRFNFSAFPFSGDAGSLSSKLCSSFQDLYHSNFEKDSSVASTPKADKPKAVKPEWQLWYEMDEADRVRSFSKEGLFDPSLHAFFFDDSLDPDAGPIDASSFSCNLGLKVIVTLVDPDADTPEIAQVLYVWEYADNHHIATAWGAVSHFPGEAHLNSVLCFVEDWCQANLDRGGGVKGAD